MTLLRSVGDLLRLPTPFLDCLYHFENICRWVSKSSR